MSDYGEQWRERRQYRQSKTAGYCLCGATLFKNSKSCTRCSGDNPYYRAKKDTSQ